MQDEKEAGVDKKSAGNDKESYGITFEGVRFNAPRTPSAWDTMTHLNVPMIFVWSFVFAQIALSRSGWIGTVGHIAVFMFWRCAYNIGLGWILRNQSNSSAFVSVYRKLVNSKYGSLVHLLIQGHMTIHNANYDISEQPDAFNAWILFRNLVDLILCSDLTAYLLLVFHFAQMPTFGILPVLQYILGFALCVFNFWAKIDAHRCVGEFAWYWGDFFFKVQQDLTFDGIFELFPHPMYTVGYSLFYGFALISRSYTVLFVSLCAHALQIAFLILVENPHIDKVYGKNPGPVLDSRTFNLLYKTSNGTESPRSAVLFAYLDPFSIADIAVVITSVYAFFLVLHLNSPVFIVIHAIIIRSVHWALTGGILYFESTQRLWTQTFLSRGFTLNHAFLTWKQLYNFSATLNLTIFIATSIRLGFFPTSITSLSAPMMSRVLLGITLCALAFWVSWSIYHSLGDFGWFYGDFFVPKSIYLPAISYSGIYRFMNNPDCVIGYAGLHGMALISQSWTVFFLALLAQLMNILFVRFVEVPHMNALYQQNLRRHEPLEVAIKDKLPSALREEVKKIREKAVLEISDLYSKFSTAGSDQGNFQVQIEEVPSKHLIGEPLTIRFSTLANHSPMDWIGLFSVGTPSGPGLSNGRWMYVPPGSRGSLTFSDRLLPLAPGLFEFRYHSADSYRVIASSWPIVFEANSTSSAVHLKSQ